MRATNIRTIPALSDLTARMQERSAIELLFTKKAHILGCGQVTAVKQYSLYINIPTKVVLLFLSEQVSHAIFEFNRLRVAGRDRLPDA